MLVQQGVFDSTLVVGIVDQLLAARANATDVRFIQVSGPATSRASQGPYVLACVSHPVVTASRTGLLRIQPAPRLQLLGMSSFTQPSFSQKA